MQFVGFFSCVNDGKDVDGGSSQIMNVCIFTPIMCMLIFQAQKKEKRSYNIL